MLKAVLLVPDATGVNPADLGKPFLLKAELTHRTRVLPVVPPIPSVQELLGMPTQFGNNPGFALLVDEHEPLQTKQVLEIMGVSAGNTSSVAYWEFISVARTAGMMVFYFYRIIEADQPTTAELVPSIVEVPLVEHTTPEWLLTTKSPQ